MTYNPSIISASDYTTGEVDTGTKWHNGKAIFKKTLTGIAGAAVGVQVDTAHGISTLEEIVGFEGIADDGTNQFPITRNFNGARLGWFADQTNFSIRADVSSGVGQTTHVTLYYTKA